RRQDMSAKKSPKRNVPLEPPTLRLAGAPEAGPGQTPPHKLRLFSDHSPNRQRNGHAAGHPLTQRRPAMTTKKKTGKTSAATPQKATKAPKARATKASEAPPKKLSALNAAARVLQETKQAMTCPEMIEAMAAKGYWTSPGGKTPAATLYSSILRE